MAAANSASVSGSGADASAAAAMVEGAVIMISPSPVLVPLIDSALNGDGEVWRGRQRPFREAQARLVRGRRLGWRPTR